MTIVKKALVAGAAAAAIGLMTAGTVGLASAATPATNSGDGSIAEKIATKFNLNKDEVQAVFDEEHKARKAEMKQHEQEYLAQAVADGKLTQEQADHITQVRSEIDVLMDGSRPQELSEETHKQIREKMEALRKWAEENNIDMFQVKAGGHGLGDSPKHFDKLVVTRDTEASEGNND